MGLSLGAPEDGGAKRIREEHKLSMAPVVDNHHRHQYTDQVKHWTVDPRYNKSLYNEVLGVTNGFLYTSKSKIYEKEPWYKLTKPLYSEQILPIPWPFFISRFHYTHLPETEGEGGTWKKS